MKIHICTHCEIQFSTDTNPDDCPKCQQTYTLDDPPEPINFNVPIGDK